MGCWVLFHRECQWRMKADIGYWSSMDEGKYEGATTKDVIVRMVAIALADEDDIDVPVRWLLSRGEWEWSKWSAQLRNRYCAWVGNQGNRWRSETQPGSCKSHRVKIFGDEHDLHPFAKSQSKEIHTLKIIVNVCKFLYFGQLCQQFCLPLPGKLQPPSWGFFNSRHAVACWSIWWNKLHRSLVFTSKTMVKPWTNHGFLSHFPTTNSMISWNSDWRKTQQQWSKRSTAQKNVLPENRELYF